MPAESQQRRRRIKRQASLAAAAGEEVANGREDAYALRVRVYGDETKVEDSVRGRVHEHAVLRAVGAVPERQAGRIDVVVRVPGG